MSGDVTPYTGLIPSYNSGFPKFMAMIAATCQPMADGIAVFEQMLTLFDLDTAVGDQLDALGEWIGISRNLSEPLTGVYFSFGVAGLGWGQGTWKGPYDPTSGLVSLPDDAYRTLLRAKIASNYWDGTIPGAEAVLAPVFPGDTVFVQDNQDMSMYIGVIGPVPLNATTYALLTGGYLDVKPATVRIAGYVTSSVPNTPVFGFGVNNATIGGFGYGAWATIAPGS